MVEAPDAEVDPEAPVAQTIEDRLKALWPKGNHVDVAVPGTAMFSGVILGHGNGRTKGKVMVRPDGATGNTYKWVPADHLYRCDEDIEAELVTASAAKDDGLDAQLELHGIPNGQ